LTSRQVYFPEGDWYDYFTGKKYHGRQHVNVPLTISQIPVFARAGSFIPTTRPVSSTDFYRADNYTIRYYPSGHSTFVQYEDDGLNNQAFSENQFEKISYTGDSSGDRIRVSIRREGSWPGMPINREMTLAIRNEQTGPVKVRLNNLALTEVTGTLSGFSVSEGFVWVRFSWDGSPVEVEVKR